MLTPQRNRRLVMIALALLGLIITFLFQRFDYSQYFFDSGNQKISFIFNRSLRYLINDNLVLLLIFGIFYDKKYIKFGLIVELFGFLFLLIPYFLLRYYTAIDHMYISFLHRLIVNPTLMILLIPAIYLQRSDKDI